jgi:hypothetical protein
VTKTEAKSEYLLVEDDLEGRPESLRYVLRRNARHERWSSMKLYLRTQVPQCIARSFWIMHGCVPRMPCMAALLLQSAPFPDQRLLAVVDSWIFFNGLPPLNVPHV